MRKMNKNMKTAIALTGVSPFIFFILMGSSGRLPNFFIISILILVEIILFISTVSAMRTNSWRFMVSCMVLNTIFILPLTALIYLLIMGYGI